MKKRVRIDLFILKALVKNFIWFQSVLKSFILPGLKYSLSKDLQAFNENMRINQKVRYLNMNVINSSMGKIVLRVTEMT